MPEDEVATRLSPWGTTKDLALVFGEGPIKQVVDFGGLTAGEKETWRQFCHSPLQHHEHNWYALYGNGRATGRWPRNDVQWPGRVRLKRMGRITALAAGASLVQGWVQHLVLSGGPTMPKKDTLPLCARISGSLSEEDDWPSEAAVMADIIRRRFGQLYETRFHRSIHEAITLEPRARNTIENVVLSINVAPALASSTRVGLISADQHLPRVLLLAHRFGVQGEAFSAQALLGRRASARGRASYARLMHCMKDISCFPALQQEIDNQARWMRGLTDPRYITYWLGFVFMLDDHALIERVLAPLRVGAWRGALASATAKVGVESSTLLDANIQVLAEERPREYELLRRRLGQLSEPWARAMPPP